MRLDKDAWRREWAKITSTRLRGEIADAYEMLSLPAKSINPDVDEQLIRTAVQARLTKFANAVLRIDEGVLWTLQVLRKRDKKLGLVGNADAIQTASWSKSPLNDVFDTVVFSCEVGLVKPDKEIYVYACNDLGVTLSECLYVGDGGSDELRSAKALGMTTVQMTGIIARLCPEVVEERGKYADFHIDNIASLISEA